nr:hypothetical protein K-LCC10_0314 [Kaumoebavirus]
MVLWDLVHAIDVKLAGITTSPYFVFWVPPQK